MCPHDFAGAMVNHVSHEFASLLIGGQGYADKDKTVETEFLTFRSKWLCKRFTSVFGLLVDPR